MSAYSLFQNHVLLPRPSEQSRPSSALEFESPIPRPSIRRLRDHFYGLWIRIPILKTAVLVVHVCYCCRFLGFCVPRKFFHSRCSRRRSCCCVVSAPCIFWPFFHCGSLFCRCRWTFDAPTTKNGDPFLLCFGLLDSLKHNVDEFESFIPWIIIHESLQRNAISLDPSLQGCIMRLATCPES